MSQPPTEPPGPSGDQPAYGQPDYGPPRGQPPTGQPTGQPTDPQYPDPNPPPYVQPQYGQQPGWSEPSPAQYGADVRQTEAGYAQLYGQKRSTGLAVASLVLGILGLLASPWPIGSYLAVLLALLAVIFGIIAVRRPVGKGMAIAGLILGGIALVVSIIASVFWTKVGADIIQITQQCIDQTGQDSGPDFDRCINQKSRNYNPFD